MGKYLEKMMFYFGFTTATQTYIWMKNINAPQPTPSAELLVEIASQAISREYIYNLNMNTFRKLCEPNVV